MTAKDKQMIALTLLAVVAVIVALYGIFLGINHVVPFAGLHKRLRCVPWLEGQC